MAVGVCVYIYIWARNLWGVFNHLLFFAVWNSILFSVYTYVHHIDLAIYALSFQSQLFHPALEINAVRFDCVWSSSWHVVFVVCTSGLVAYSFTFNTSVQVHHMRICIQIYIHKQMHIRIHTYRHTYIETYIHTCIQLLVAIGYTHERIHILYVYIHIYVLTSLYRYVVSNTGWHPLSVTMAYQGMNLVLGRRAGLAKRCFLEPKSLEAFFMIVGSEGSKFKHKATIESKLMYSLSCLCYLPRIVDVLMVFQIVDGKRYFWHPTCLYL